MVNSLKLGGAGGRVALYIPEFSWIKDASGFENLSGACSPASIGAGLDPGPRPRTVLYYIRIPEDLRLGLHDSFVFIL